jgi:hypothetical protein
MVQFIILKERDNIYTLRKKYGTFKSDAFVIKEMVANVGDGIQI